MSSVAKTCAVDGCDGGHCARGYCRSHYSFLMRSGFSATHEQISAIRRKSAEFKIPHGVYTKYSNDKCRCDPCRVAWNDYCRTSRNSKRDSWDGNRREDLTHGLASTYHNHGCKCTECLAAASLASSARQNIRNNPLVQQYKKSVLLCEICQRRARRMVSDHDHGTGQFRGILCDSCNTALGKFSDSVEMLEAAIAYLKRPNPLV